jgi:hypothetical protein
VGTLSDPGLQGGDGSGPPRGNRVLGPVSFTIGAAIGVAVFLTVASVGGVSLVSHTTCERRGTIGTTLFWTPYSLENAPYLGATYYSADFQLYELFGPTKVALRAGEVGGGNVSAGYFETENWTVFSQANASQLGPGFDRPCSSLFGAVQSPTNFTSSYGGLVLQGPGNSSNRNEPTTFPLPTTHAVAAFADGFRLANQQSVSTCGTSWKELPFSSSSFDISLTVLSPKGALNVVASVASNENFSYYFPANSGTWLVDDLQLNPGLTGPGLAFEWQAC